MNSLIFLCTIQGPLQYLYPDPLNGSIFEALLQRILINPFNVVATICFLLAIIHTFFTAKIKSWAHDIQQKYKEKGGQGECPKAGILEFFGEVEVVFGLWIIPLLIFMGLYYNWKTVVHYMNHQVIYTEALFVTVIMAIASSRPILLLAEHCIQQFAQFGKLTPLAWWFSILTIGPLFGSLITEPAAMTIAALLLSKQFYQHAPSQRLKYATLGLLFVNISIGGTLTHFAAPPIVMVVGPWNWSLSWVFSQFGIKSICAILISTIAYALFFAKEFHYLNLNSKKNKSKETTNITIPAWVNIVHIGFLAWTILCLHAPVLCIGGFLFFLGFMKVTTKYQNQLNLVTPLLVGFFLAGLVTHGSLQGWWLEVMLSRCSEWPLFLGSTFLTAFNDNAAITFLATLVPSINQNVQLQQAVVMGAITGGGLTVIANAPNPAGQSILSKFFKEGISPLFLFLSALIPTIIVALIMMGI